MGLEDILFRRTANYFRLPQSHPILLAEPRSCEPHRSVQTEQPTGLVAIPSYASLLLISQSDIERAIGVQPLETVSIHPGKPLYEACRRMLESRARRMPLVDIDDETKRAMVVSVVTQYRILKFVAVNVSETQLLRKPLKHLKLGTYKNLETARMETPVFEVIHQLVNSAISSVPIVNSDGELMHSHQWRRLNICRRSHQCF